MRGFRWRRRRPSLESIRGRLALDPASRLLDVGGGDGGAVSIYGHGAGEVVVLDPDARRTATGRRDHPTIRFETAVAEHLPEPDGHFDRVVFLLSYHHLEDPRRALAEAHRVLAPGGSVWVGDVPTGSLRARLFATLHRLSGHGALHFPSDGELDGALTAAGFRGIVRERVGGLVLVHAARGGPD